MIMSKPRYKSDFIPNVTTWDWDRTSPDDYNPAAKERMERLRSGKQEDVTAPLNKINDDNSNNNDDDLLHSGCGGTDSNVGR